MIIGILGREILFFYVIDPNFMYSISPPLPFYAIPLSALTLSLILLSLPVSIAIEIARWIIKAHPRKQLPFPASIDSTTDIHTVRKP